MAVGGTVGDVKPRLRRVAAALMAGPDALPLTDTEFRARHNTVIAAVFATVSLAIFATPDRYPTADNLPAIFFVVVLTIVAMTSRTRRVRATLATVALYAAATVASLVDPGPHTQLLFIAAIPLTATYRDRIILPVTGVWAVIDSVATIVGPTDIDPIIWTALRAVTVIAVTGVTWGLETTRTRHERLAAANGQVLAAAAEAIVSFHADGTVATINPTGRAWLGGRADVVAVAGDGRCPTGHLDGDDRPVDPAECVVCRCARDGTPARAHVWIRDEHGKARSVDVAVSPLGSNAGTVMIITDRTDRDRADLLATEAAATEAVVATLVDAVTPTVPAVAGWDIVAVHVPAAGPVGGDLADIAVLGDEDVVYAAVVDAVGKGVEATSAALGVARTLRVLAQQGTAAVALVDECAGLVDVAVEATVVAALIDRRSGAVTVTTASHPPALSMSGGVVDEFVTSGIAVGWPRTVETTTDSRVLAPGELLVLYSDGLLDDARDTLSGLATVRGIVAAHDGVSAGELAALLVDGTGGTGGRSDDTTVVVIRRLPLVAERMVVSSLRDLRALGVVAQRVCGSAGVTVDGDRVELVVRELAGNAVDASGEGVVRLQSTESGGVVVEVVNVLLPSATVVVPAGLGMPDPVQLGGRGLPIVREVADEVSVHSVAVGSHVEVKVTARFEGAGSLT